MRKTIAGVLVLLVIFLAGAIWPFTALYDIATKAEAGDAAALNQRIDLPAFRRSLTGQLIRTYIRLSGIKVNPGGIAAGVAGSIVTQSSRNCSRRKSWQTCCALDGQLACFRSALPDLRVLVLCMPAISGLFLPARIMVYPASRSPFRRTPRSRNNFGFISRFRSRAGSFLPSICLRTCRSSLSSSSSASGLRA